MTISREQLTKAALQLSGLSSDSIVRAPGEGSHGWTVQTKNNCSWAKIADGDVVLRAMILDALDASPEVSEDEIQEMKWDIGCLKNEIAELKRGVAVNSQEGVG